MRNTHKLAMELRMLRDRYGGRNVVAPSSYEWVKLVGFPLLQGKYNLDACTLLIMIPEGYDASSVQECYTDKDLALINRFGAKEGLPHLHGAARYGRDGYQWICLHSPQEKTDLIHFLHVLRAYFTDPYEYVRINTGGL